jgi:hypothetical protein
MQWTYKGVAYPMPPASERTPCPACNKPAVVALPAAILAEQSDETTHVCHPLLGGCNGGYVVDSRILAGPPPSKAKTEADIEAALMQHPHIETVKAHETAGDCFIYVRKAGDADELIRRLGVGVRHKVAGYRQWFVQVPFRKGGK